ncbi:hypothetical protein [Dyadobacter bucti]|uniref:hypothetical protein n=1 Tax=Dyadobacter bucti TaxID=2572203 RepID=UPI003F71DD31
MKKIYLLLFTALTLACQNKNDTEEYIYQDTTAVTVETPAMDTTIVDSLSANVPFEGTVLEGIESEAYWKLQEEMLGMTLSEKKTFLEEYEQQLTNLERIGNGHKYNSRRGSSGSYEYNYDIFGEDEDGNSISGNIDIEGKYGTGYVTDENGNEKSIEVEWIDYGVLEGTDEDGVSYKLRVDE